MYFSKYLSDYDTPYSECKTRSEKIEFLSGIIMYSSVEFYRYSIDIKSSINAADEGGRTLLGAAICRNRPSFVESFLKQGAIPNHPNQVDEIKELFLSSYYKNEDQIRAVYDVLRKAGATDENVSCSIYLYKRHVFFCHVNHF